MRTLLLAYGRFQRDGVLRDLLYLPHVVDGNLQALGEFFQGGLAAEFLHHFAAGAYHLVDGFDHVHWHAYRARLISDSPRNSLANPPCSIGRKLLTAPPLELLCSPHEADISLLDQVQELQAMLGV